MFSFKWLTDYYNAALSLLFTPLVYLMPVINHEVLLKQRHHVVLCILCRSSYTYLPIDSYTILLSQQPYIDDDDDAVYNTATP